MRARRPSLTWPLVLIAGGGLLLAQGLGLLPPGIWASLAELWPALLIFWGLELLIGWRSPRAAWLALILTVLALAAALTWAALRA